MKLKFLRLLFILTLSITTLLTGCKKIDSPKSNHDIKELKVITAENYPPYIFKDENGNLKGIIVDEWNLWSIKTGIDVKLEVDSWNNAQMLMNIGKYDVIDCIAKNKERSRIYDFSKPYGNIDAVIFFNEEISGITDISSLKDFKVGVEKGDSNINLLEQNNIDSYIVFDSYESIIEAARDKIINVFIMDKPPALYLLHKYHIHNQFRYTKPQHTSKIHRAVLKDDSVLLRIIDQGFSQISKAEHKKIYNKWFGFEYMGTDYSYFIKIFFISFLIISVLLVLWNIALKKAVNQKTLELTNTIKKLQKSENKIKTLFRSMPDLFFLITTEGVFVDLQVNDFKKLIYAPHKLINKSINQIFDSQLSQKFMNALNKSITSGDIQIIEYILPINEENNYFEARIIKYDIDLILVIIRDITEKKLSDIKMYNMSIKDGITGLYNRNYFETEMEMRNNDRLSNYSLIVCDLDGLKFINDTLGHSVGDEYLKTAAYALKRCFTKEDTIIARIGGDEFGILMKDVSEKEIFKMKSRLKALINEINIGKVIPMSISLGYSISSNKSKNLREMFKEADSYMYKEKLHHKQSSKSDLVNILMKMLATRDFITEGHCDRLQFLSMRLAKTINMTESQIQDMLLLSKFHDIGKIGVSDRVLFKPEKLTKEEFNEMKRHTEIGYRIAQASPDIAHLADWILKHHEWWNGKGYPFGLKKNKIPIQCRILSIVDAYDSMTSDRPYRKALSKTEAINELKRCSGTQFDPNLVGNFLEIISELDVK